MTNMDGRRTEEQRGGVLKDPSIRPRPVQALRGHHARAVRLFREPIFVSAFNLMTNGGITAVLGFVFIMLISQIFLPADVGLYSAIISAAGLLALFSRLGFDIGLIRFLSTTTDPNGLIRSCQSVNLASAVVLSVIFIVGVGTWSPSLLFVSQSAQYAFLFVGLTALISISYIQHNLYIAKGLTGQLVMRDIVRDLIKIGAVFALVPLGLSGMLWAYLLGLVISFLLATAVLRRTLPDLRAGLGIHRGLVRDIFQYSAHNYLAGMIGSAPFLILPLIVVNLLGPEQGAYFFVAWSTSTIIFLAIDAVATSFFAEGSRDADRVGNMAISSLRMAYLILLPVIVITVLFAGDLLKLFGPAYAANSADLLIVLAFSSLPMAFNQIYVNLKRVTLDMRPVIAFNISMAAGMLGLGTVLMATYGLIGAGMAFLIVQLVLMAFIAHRWRPWRSRIGAVS
jgi:O-antigen/teichoic acid export membrane protein